MNLSDADSVDKKIMMRLLTSESRTVWEVIA